MNIPTGPVFQVGSIVGTKFALTQPSKSSLSLQEAVTVLNMHHDEMEVLRFHTAFLWLVESIHRRQRPASVLSLQMRTAGGLEYPPSISDADQQPLGA